MNTFDDIESARVYAKDKPKGKYIIEVVLVGGERAFVLCAGNAEALRKTMPSEIIDIIGDAVDLVAERVAQQLADDVAALNAAIANGTALMVANITEQYGSELSWARRFREDEKGRYADWYKDLGMVGFSGSRIEVSRQSIRQVVGDRASDGQFNGCSNHAWTISKDEWDAIVAAEEKVKAIKSAIIIKNQVDDEQDIAHKIATGYCFYCGSYCYGDCGHYSNDPFIELKQDMDQGQREMPYGISEG